MNENSTKRTFHFSFTPLNRTTQLQLLQDAFSYVEKLGFHPSLLYLHGRPGFVLFSLPPPPSPLYE